MGDVERCPVCGEIKRVPGEPKRDGSGGVFVWECACAFLRSLGVMGQPADATLIAEVDAIGKAAGLEGKP